MEVDDPDDEWEEEESGTEFLEAVRIFMEYSGHDRFVQLEPSDLHCQLCIDDPTMSEEDKNKQWANQTKLRYHQATNVHSPRMT